MLLLMRMLRAVVASWCVVATLAGPIDAPGGPDGPYKSNKQSNNGRHLAVLEEDTETPTSSKIVGDEGKSIGNVDIPFQQAPEDWERQGKGISMDLTGEPKSGTTWTQRITTDLAVFLCGSETNTWCKMGGLEVIPRRPDPSYIWELLHADTGELFLHFDGREKHPIPGFKVKEECLPEGRWHRQGFAKTQPCQEHGDPLSREQLLGCLPLITSGCASLMPSRYPDVRRMAVVFRDPRDVVISSHRYRTETAVFKNQFVPPDLLDYIDYFFKIIVSWQHQRWVWHTTFYREASYVMFYEDLKANYLSLVDLAAFMELDCSPEQARNVWERHSETKPHGGYDSYGLPTQKIEFMNDTMSRLLPVDMLTRYGLTPVVF